MTGTTVELRDYIFPDAVGCFIANKYVTWRNLMQQKMGQWEEVRKYLFATDTTQTTNNKLPWKNKTTIPKLTQIRDNLFANYMAVEFPKRKWLDWLAARSEDAAMEKREAILAYMNWAISQPQYKSEIAKCILDYIDYGNCFACVEWVDERVEYNDRIQAGYIGPMPRRISPLDIVFNPTAPSFIETPKIIRSMVSIGELKKKMESMSNDENRQEYEDLFKYLMEYRQRIQQSPGDLSIQDTYFAMDGFSSFRQYLEGDYVEILTFYGDIYDHEKQELLQNHMIMVVDRHKVIAKKPNPSYFGHPPIWHVGWRVRQDNLWAMGPLDNLVGMQYRLDHIENLKADVFDLIAFPVLKIKGYVNPFEWGPMQRIVTDGEGDVEMLAPPFQVLQVNNEIQYLITMMEEMAGAPKEAMGFRTPGEKTAFEVQRMENAGGRIFVNKTSQFDDMFHERVLNGMLEQARRMVSGPQEINVFDNEFNFQTFMTLTPDDITGAGRIKPLAARHFAERAETVQNITNLFSSGILQDQMISVHFSGFEMAKALEELLDLQDYGIVQENIRVTEKAKVDRLMAAQQEQTQMQMGTQTGLTPDDHTGADMPSPMQAPMPMPQQAPK